MDFYSAYAHGFARVAACTIPVAIADPASNAASVLAEARACSEEQVAVAVFPELCLSGYAIDDLHLQDTLLVAVEEAVAEIVAASVDLLPVLVVGAPLVHGTRVLNCAVVIHRGRVSGSRRSRTCRPTASSTSGAGSLPATTCAAPRPWSPARRCPWDRTWSSRPPTCRGLALHAEVCEDMWVPVPPTPRPRSPAPPCW